MPTPNWPSISNYPTSPGRFRTGRQGVANPGNRLRPTGQPDHPVHRRRLRNPRDRPGDSHFQDDGRSLVQIARTNGWERALKSAFRHWLFDGPYFRRLAALYGQPLPLDRAQVRVMSATHLDLPDDYFDFIFSTLVFEHIDDVPAAVREVNRVLSPEAAPGSTSTSFPVSRADTTRNGPNGAGVPAPGAPWDHLLDNRYPVAYYLNKLRLADYRNIFNTYLEVREDRPLVETDELLTPALAEVLLAQGYTGKICLPERSPSSAGRSYPSPRFEPLRNLAKNSLAILLGLAISFLLLEGLLRVFQPIEYRVRGDKLKLPRDKKYQFSNAETDKFDRLITTSRNHLGFRGEMPPKDFAGSISIVAVGGSTTACEMISDGKTWCDLLAARLKSRFGRVWLNNAGLDGTSTYGHLVLMEDYLIKLRPQVVLFLVGANEIHTKDHTSHDLEFLRKSQAGFLRGSSMRAKFWATPSTFTGIPRPGSSVCSIRSWILPTCSPPILPRKRPKLYCKSIGRPISASWPGV